VKRVCLALGACCLVGCAVQNHTPTEPRAAADYLGQVRYARAVEDVGSATPIKGEANRLRFNFPEAPGLERVNLTVPVANTALTLQPNDLKLYTVGAHNAKLMLGYMGEGWQFSHGDNNDLAHWAGRDRVVLFVPIRHAYAADPEKPANYFISPHAGQTICVVQFKAGELIRYEWFKTTPLHENILFDLSPYCAYDNDLRPAVNQPIFRFDVFPGGGWRVQIERDGRDGLAGGENPRGYDQVFTHEYPGAKPYSVDLDWPNACSVTVHAPSADHLEATMELTLAPYDRGTGQPVEGFAWTPTQRDVPIDAQTSVTVHPPAKHKGNAAGSTR